MQLIDDTICPTCSRDLTIYDTELMNYGEKELHIQVCGACPHCKKSYVWREIYTFDCIENMKVIR